MIWEKKSIWLALSLGVILFSVYLVGLLKKSDAVVEAPLDQKIFLLELSSDPASPVSSETVQSKKSIRQFIGEKDATFIHFWAAWCAPCLEELPGLVKFMNEEEAKKSNLQVLAISLDPTQESAVNTWRRAVGNQNISRDIILFWDPKMKIAHGLGSYQFPETYLFGSDASLLQKWVGPQSWVSPLFKSEVAHLILRVQESSGTSRPQ